MATEYNYRVDYKKTLFDNIPQIIFTGAIAGGFFLAARWVNTLTSDLKPLALIALLLIVPTLFKYAFNFRVVVYKEDIILRGLRCSK